MKIRQLIKALKAMDKAARISGVDPDVKFNGSTGNMPVKTVRFEQEPGSSGPVPVIVLYNWTLQT